MDPLLVQQQLKNNNRDFFDFCDDLKSWGKEMEKQDHERNPPRQPTFKDESELLSIKKQKDEGSNKSKEISKLKRKCLSYEDWDKFDADRECEKVDEDSDSSSGSLIEDLKEQAIREKEQGNKYVKLEQWKEAIRSYTNAIKYFAYDPIFYANRALCFLKTEEIEKAEQDCNISIKLDNTYVKAYQRRAVAREALNKFEEAKLDLLRVLELEPKNLESRKKFDELMLKIRNFDTQNSTTPFHQPFLTNSSQVSKHREYQKKKSHLRSENVDIIQGNSIWPNGDVENIVQAIQKPPQLRSSKPTTRISIQERNSAIAVLSKNPNGDENHKNFPSFDKGIIKRIIKSPEVNPIQGIGIENPSKHDLMNEKETDLVAPKTSIEFHAVWKQLREQNNKRAKYLRLIKPEKIPDIFKDSLESDVFGEILCVLEGYFEDERDLTYDFLLNLSKIRRFSALSGFFTLDDKKNMWRMISTIKEMGQYTEEDINNLLYKYGL